MSINVDNVMASASVVAVFVSVFAVYRTYLVEKKVKHLAIRTALSSVLNRLDSRTVYTTPPQSEHWEDGFQSLDESRNVIAKARQVLAVHGHRDGKYDEILHLLLDEHKAMVPHRDDYRKRGYGFDSVAAEETLGRLQYTVEVAYPQLEVALEDFK